MSKSLEKKIIDICVFLHTELSSMQSNLDDTLMDLSDVLHLEVNQALELITENIRELLKVKRNFLVMEEYKNYKAHEQYQKALQKLEGEVRHHIKIEQQMKLHIDSTQAKLEEYEKNKSDSSTVENLKRENGKLIEKIKNMERQSENNEEKMRYVKELNVLKGLAQKDSQKNSELEKINRKLEIEVSYLQRKLEVVNREAATDRYLLKENRPVSSSKKRNSEDNMEEIRVISSQLTERCRNLSKSDLTKKNTSKSPINARSELKRTESQFLSSTRGIKKSSAGLEKPKKHVNLIGSTNYSIR